MQGNNQHPSVQRGLECLPNHARRRGSSPAGRSRSPYAEWWRWGRSSSLLAASTCLMGVNLFSLLVQRGVCVPAPAKNRCTSASTLRARELPAEVR